MSTSKFVKVFCVYAAPLALAAFSGSASASSCDYYWDSSCIERVDIFGSSFQPPYYPPYDPYANGGSVGGGGAPQELSPSEKVIKAAKTAPNLCKKPSETCEAWGARMKNPSGPILDGNGAPTGVNGSGFCPSISSILPIVGQAVCNQAINHEVALEGCINVTCP